MMLRVVNQQLKAVGDGSAWNGEQQTGMTAVQAAAAAATALREEREREAKSNERQTQQRTQHKQQKRERSGDDRKKQAGRPHRRWAELEEERRKVGTFFTKQSSEINLPDSIRNIHSLPYVVRVLIGRARPTD